MSRRRSSATCARPSSSTIAVWPSCASRSQTSLPKLDEKYKVLKERLATRYEAAWREMADRWRDGMQAAAAELDAINREVDGYCPAWNEGAWSDRALPRVVPPVVRFGTVPLDLGALPRGIPADARLMEDVPKSFVFPALRTFPASANLLIETPAEGRGAALAVLQASMFRLLTSLPPGQVRFTIVDPIGIGRNFGAFMHLADFDGCACHPAGLDRRAPDRGAAGRPGDAHGDRDAEIPPERVRDDRRVQRRRRGGRRAVPGAGRRRLPDQIRREVGRPAGRHRGRRRSLRRPDTCRRRPLQAAAVAVSSSMSFAPTATT